MMEYRFVTIEQWPGEKTRSRERSRFRTSWSDTLRLLERELSMLRARNIVIQADCGEDQIRRDGMLRSDARLRGPGIILTFDSKHGPLSYPCDRYLHWECNVRAIALSLDALRSVDRYGVTRRAEQYKGWAKIAGPAMNGAMTTDKAAEFVARYSTAYSAEQVMSSKEVYRAAYRAAAAELHPDCNGGDDASFLRLQEAKAVIDRVFGI